MKRASRIPFLLVAALAVSPVTARAGDLLCHGTITSIQGEGLVAKTHRFEVESVGGSDLESVIDKCKKIAQDKQNRAARKNPGGNFRPFSELDLQCQQDGQKTTVRRSVKTAP
jgi:hypothetical protein